MKTREVIKYLGSVALAALLLYLSFRGIEWSKLKEAIVGCNWSFVFLTMVVSVAAAWIRSRRWRSLILPFDPQLDSLSTFNGVNIGYLANLAFPRIGEFIRCGFVSRRSAKRHQNDPENAVSYEKTLGTVLMSRSWDLIVSALLVVVLVIAKFDTVGAFFTRDVRGIMAQSDGSGTKFLLIAGIIIAAIAAFIFIIRHFKDSKPIVKIRGFLRGMGQGFASWAKMPRKWLFFVYTILLWTMYWLQSYFIMKSMPEFAALTWIDAWVLCMVGSISWIIPVPGGMGAYHTLVPLAVTSIYAMSHEAGMAFAILNHETQILVMILFGIISYIIELKRK